MADTASTTGTDERLVAALVRLGAGRHAATEVVAELMARWAEPHRRYHDVRHLTEVLDRVDELAGHAREPDVVRLAAGWHDAVHDGMAGDDERASALLARKALDGLGLPAMAVGKVSRLVLVTIDHEPAGPDDADGAVLCDADLAVLGAGPERYAEYASLVRQEYAHVDDEEFRIGRSDVLRWLLAKPHLFRTPTAAAWEDAARRNLSAELDRLDAARR